jgi:hypothetical protein
MTGGIRCADHATPSISKSWHHFAKKRRSLGRHSSLADQNHVFFFFFFFFYVFFFFLTTSEGESWISSAVLFHGALSIALSFHPRIPTVRRSIYAVYFTISSVSRPVILKPFWFAAHCETYTNFLAHFV